MISRRPIREYVTALDSHLGGLEPAEAEEVVREIESHIHEVVDHAEQRGETVDIARMLEGFGPPEALARQYVAHLRTGAPPPTGFRVIQRVTQSVTRGLYYGMGAFGFSIAIAFLLLAFAKVLWPSLVGAWSASGGNSVVITWSGAPSADAKELLGPWLVPCALVAAAWSFELTRRVLRVLHRGLA